MNQEMLNQIGRLLTEWHEAGRPGFTAAYSNLDYDSQNKKRAIERKKWVLLDSGTSGVFALDKTTGAIYKIKAYGVPNLKRLIGHIGCLDGKALHIAGDYWA